MLPLLFQKPRVSPVAIFKERQAYLVRPAVGLPCWAYLCPKICCCLSFISVTSLHEHYLLSLLCLFPGRLIRWKLVHLHCFCFSERSISSLHFLDFRVTLQNAELHVFFRLHFVSFCAVLCVVNIYYLLFYIHFILFSVC